jgi:site-specific DNA-methyltransferase (adenine-specific)/site-specific DNA-methyltransferase (cytosine-N4-specific)
MSATILCGNCLDQIPQIPNRSIAACITSPPYAERRKTHYGGIPERHYPAWTVQWMRALRPKMTKDGNVLIVIRPHLKDGCISDYVLRTRLALRADGWTECEELIWLKPDAPPLGSVLRPRRAWESILWFSMIAKPYVDLKACGSESHRIGGFFGSDRFPAGNDMPVHQAKRRVPQNGWSRISDVFSASIGDIDQGIQHPAMYPRSLIDLLVLTFSRPGDCVLDPFCGSGTSCLSAVANGRRAIGIDLVKEYADLARQRLSAPLIGFSKEPKRITGNQPGWLRVADNSGLTAREFRVLSHLWRHARRDDKTVRTGIRSIARVCGISKNTAVAVIRELKGLGYLEVDDRRNGQHNIYRLFGLPKLSPKIAGKPLLGLGRLEDKKSGGNGRQKCLQKAGCEVVLT